MRAKTILRTLVLLSSIAGFPSLGVAQPGGEDPAELDEENEDPEPEQQEEGGDPVVLTTGNFVLRATDLRIAGRGMDFTFDRVYRSGSEVHSDLGRRWDHNWNQRLVIRFENNWVPPYRGPSAEPAGGQSNRPPASLGGTSSVSGGGPSGGSRPVPVDGLYFFNGELRIERMSVDEATGRITPPAGYAAKVRPVGGGPNWAITPPDAFELRHADGAVYTFGVSDLGDPFVAGRVYRLTEVRDRTGNRIRLDYVYRPHPVQPTRQAGYVVRNDRTGDIVQVSDRTDSAWRAPWN